MLGDPKTTLKVMVINFVIPSLILSMKMANFALSAQWATMCQFGKNEFYN